MQTVAYAPKALMVCFQCAGDECLGDCYELKEVEMTNSMPEVIAWICETLVPSMRMEDVMKWVCEVLGNHMQETDLIIDIDIEECKLG